MDTSTDGFMKKRGNLERRRPKTMRREGRGQTTVRRGKREGRVAVQIEMLPLNMDAKTTLQEETVGTVSPAN